MLESAVIVETTWYVVEEPASCVSKKPTSCLRTDLRYSNRILEVCRSAVLAQQSPSAKTMNSISLIKNGYVNYELKNHACMLEMEVVNQINYQWKPIIQPILQHRATWENTETENKWKPTQKKCDLNTKNEVIIMNYLINNGISEFGIWISKIVNDIT